MKKCLFLFFVSLSPLFSNLVEWLGYGGPGLFDNPPTEEDARGIFFKQVQYRLAKRGWDITVPEKNVGQGDVMVFINSPHMDFFAAHNLFKSPPKKILITWEPPTVYSHNHDPEYHRLFDKIITWNTKLVDGKRILQYWYPVYFPMRENLPGFDDRLLVCMIIADKHSKHPKELYSERRKVIHFYESHPRFFFHLYGVGWENHHLRNFMSSPQDKIGTLTRYRFSYAYENYRNDEGYITEKIFDCFQAGTVPIYLGASNIADFIPSDCFIDARNFPSYKALHQFLENIDERHWLRYQNNIRAFLNSPAAKRFTDTTLADAIERAIFD